MKILDNIDGNEVVAVDLGEVQIEHTRTLELYLYNDSKGIVRNISVSAKGLLIEGIPSILEPNKYAKFSITWAPRIGLKSSMNTSLDISYEEVYRYGTD